MRIIVAAVGRLKQGPERALAERYRDRAVKSGRAVGLKAIDVVEIAESRAREAPRRMVEESIALASVIPDGARRVVLDPRGDNLDTPTFTATLARWRDEGRSSTVFVIGGADGLSPPIVAEADLRLAFGAATWPHQIVRIMLLEQIYRAVTLLSGHPYHRD